MKICDICGTFGHSAARCPLRRIEQKRDPCRTNPPRPKPRAVSDPATRAADEHTIFLIPPKRLV